MKNFKYSQFFGAMSVPLQIIVSVWLLGEMETPLIVWILFVLSTILMIFSWIFSLKQKYE